MLLRAAPGRRAAKAAGERLLRRGQRRPLFFSRERPKLFGIEGLESPRDFPRLAQEAIKAADRELSGAAGMAAPDLVRALDNASNELCRIADAAELCRNVHPEAKYVDHASQAVQCISTYMGEVNLDGSIYQGMVRAEEGQDFAAMAPEARKVLRHMRVSMEHEGIHLPEDEKARCLTLLEREQELAFEIVQRQEQSRRAAPGSDGGPPAVWVPVAAVTEALGPQASALPRRQGKGEQELQLPAESPWGEQVLKCAASPEARRAVHEAQQLPDERGERDMAELLSVRQQLAQLRGYPTWREYAQREALLPDPASVDSFLMSAWDRLQAGFLRELGSLAEEKERLGLGGERLEAWDVPFLIHRCRLQQEKAGGDVSEYLTFSSLMKGVELIVSKLLGLSFAQEEPAAGELWHPSVLKYSLRDGERVLGVLYLDPFARPGKVVQSAQFTLQGSKELDGGGSQVPVTTLVYSVPAGMAGLPLSYAVTFMHEIGHAVHSLLSQTTFQHLSGTRGTVDFVEFPSHLFEHFVIDPGCLASYAVHAKTGAPLPAELASSAQERQRLFAHFEAVQQLMYGAVDQAFYGCVPSAASVESGEAAGEVRRHLAAAFAQYQRSEIPGDLSALLGLSRPSRFDHLVHYGGSYYCYLFNRALSAHVWEQGFRRDPFSEEAGKRLRTFLRGGSVVQSLGAIEALCPTALGLSSDAVPLDAFVAQLGGAH